MEWRERLYCGVLTASHVGKDVLLMGWVDAIRDHGNLLFIHLRDVRGMIQVVFDPKVHRESYERSTSLREEHIIEVRGNVALREKGTERPFTGKYDKFFESGIYKCAGCGSELFVSDAKYNSGCGWPAFSAPAEKDAVVESRDTTLGMIRTEITCSKCGGHLGHVFNDGPVPTGLRYCINSAALDFEKKQD